MNDNMHKAIELTICQHSPQYFFQKYLSKAFEYRGFDYQNVDYHTDWYTSTDPTIYLRGGRHTGSTVSTVARIVWELTFKSNHTSAVIGKTNHTAELIDYVRMCIEFLPDWMRPKLEHCNKTYICTEFNSVVIVGGTSHFTLRGHSINSLYLTDIQLLKSNKLEEIIADAIPSLSRNSGQLLLTSSGRVEVDTLISVLVKLNPTILLASWDTLPGSDDNYRTNHIRKHGELYWEQNFELSVP